VWSLTRRCSLRCTFCLADAGPAAPGEGSALRRHLVEEIVRERVLKATLTGGEPLLVEELDELVARLAGGGVLVVLTTNGLLLDGARLDALRAAGVRRIQLSLAGARAETNDRLMGGAAFARILEALDCLRRASVPYDVKVTLLPENAAELAGLLALPAVAAARRVTVQEAVPLGRALTPAPRLSRAQLEAAERTTGAHGRASFRSFALEAWRQGRFVRCSAGHPDATEALLTEEGHLLPCTMALPWALSNPVVEKGLAHAWQALPVLAAPHLAVAPGGRCRGCPHLEACHGGCRAVAFALTGRHDAEYPWCPRDAVHDEAAAAAGEAPEEGVRS
jgi:pyrroloquinoline quinone biosynthesis protein E